MKTEKFIPWLASLAVLSGLAGLALGLLLAPASAQQGETYRIILVHVPVSWLSMLLYLIMAAWALLGLLRNTPGSGMATQAIAPTGALMAFLSLCTGALWGKPTWGTWWAWDARLTSELILLFLYVGFIALTRAIEDQRRAERAGHLLLLVGVVNIPIIHFSVQWWHSLHQGATLSLGKSPPMAPAMLYGLLLMVCSLSFYAATMALMRFHCLRLEREAQEA